MKTKLLALLFLVGSAAFAAPRVVVGVGVGGVGVGVGVAPAYGYYAPPPPPLLMSRQLPWLPLRILTSGGAVTGVRVLITARVGLRRGITDLATIAAGGGKSRSGSASLEGILQ